MKRLVLVLATLLLLGCSKTDRWYFTGVDEDDVFTTKTVAHHDCFGVYPTESDFEFYFGPFPRANRINTDVCGRPVCIKRRSTCPNGRCAQRIKWCCKVPGCRR